VASLHRSELQVPFKPSAPGSDRVGIEVECATLDAQTGTAARYEGDNGTKHLLRLIQAEFGGDAIVGHAGLTGVQLPDETKFSLEASGGLEYSSRPGQNLCDINKDAKYYLQKCAALACKLGLALVPGGNIPFDSMESIEWVPDDHAGLMRDFCARLGSAGIASLEVSVLAITTQTTLDQGSPHELVERLRVAFSAATVSSVLFVNSPITDGHLNGWHSWRMSRLRLEDPSRFGFPPFAVDEHINSDDYIEWLLDMPMIHYRRGDQELPAPDKNFRELMSSGFDDGRLPDLADWKSQVGQAWPFVRLRKTIELRLSDGPPYSALMAAPAFWSGFLYNSSSRRAAWEVVRGRTLSEHVDALQDIARRGLEAVIGTEKVSDLAAELLKISEAGLTDRVAAGLEREEVLSYLDPLHRVAESGQTFAQQQIRAWEGSWARQPARYVEALKIPSA